MQAVIFAIAAVVGLGLTIYLLQEVEDLGEINLGGIKINVLPVAILLAAFLIARNFMRKQ